MLAKLVYTFGPDNEVRAQGVGPLDAAQLIASRHGFYDLDVEADERGVKIVASAHKRSLTARGKNLTEACQRLVEAIYDNG